MALSTGGRGTGGVRRTTETKQALKTTEFWVFVVLVLAILIAGDNIGGGRGSDYFTADKVWLYVTILALGYLISRGLAKSGAREPYSLPDGTEGGIGQRFSKAAAVLREGDVPAGDDVHSHEPRREPRDR